MSSVLCGQISLAFSSLRRPRGSDSVPIAKESRVDPFSPDLIWPHNFYISPILSASVSHPRNWTMFSDFHLRLTVLTVLVFNQCRRRLVCQFRQICLDISGQNNAGSRLKFQEFQMTKILHEEIERLISDGTLLFRSRIGYELDFLEWERKVADFVAASAFPAKDFQVNGYR